ncbi:MAG TPA: YtxH domain-containing protein [Chitinophagaceae bacterium]|jgi:gas vesicle protein|nr:YtxH domain-containing protein [Chitinophagaceae bacterium]
MNNTSKILIALGAGVAIGGVLGILFAPDKGSVTRQKIAAGGKKFADNFNKKIKSGRGKLQEEFSKMNDVLEEEMA